MNILVVTLIQFIGHKGGMEKALTNFSNAMQKRGHEVTLMYCTERHGFAPFPIDQAVTFVNLIDWMPSRRFESIKIVGLDKIYRELWRIFDKEKAKKISFDLWINKVEEGIKAYLKDHVFDIIITADTRTAAAFLGGQKRVIVR